MYVDEEDQLNVLEFLTFIDFQFLSPSKIFLYLLMKIFFLKTFLLI